MSKTIRVMFALAIGFLTVLAVPLAAQASSGGTAPDTVTTATAPQGDQHLMYGCEVRSNVNGLRVRRTPESSDVIGQMQAGNTADAQCSGRTGPSYSVCGGGNFWVPIVWHGANGWVARSCVEWYYD